MKKAILAIAAFCVAAAFFGACEKPGEPDKYEVLNAKLNLNYSSLVITVTDTFDSDSSLISTYTVSHSDDGVKVSYSIERFAEISLENPTSDYKVTTVGEAVIKDGVVVSGDLDVSGVLPDGLNFKEEYFKNIEITSFSLEADVKDAAGFLGTEITCTDMKVSASFRDAFNSITITYKAESGNDVEYLYQFGALA